jgi:hypothetical protein
MLGACLRTDSVAEAAASDDSSFAWGPRPMTDSRWKWPRWEDEW